MPDPMPSEPERLLCPDCGHHVHRPSPGVCGYGHGCGCPAMPSEPETRTLDPDVEKLADLFMDLRLDGPVADGWTYQQTARYYARIILGRWLVGIRHLAIASAPDLLAAVEALELDSLNPEVNREEVRQMLRSVSISRPGHAEHFDPECEECAYRARPTRETLGASSREAGH